MNLYSVQTIWRHKKRYYTRTVAVMANYSADARGIARQGFLEDEIDNVRQRVWREHGCVVGESTRRCRHDMWDGVDSRRFIPEGHMPIAARVYYGYQYTPYDVETVSKEGNLLRGMAGTTEAIIHFMDGSVAYINNRNEIAAAYLPGDPVLLPGGLTQHPATV